jgi:hypothetical protein
LPINRLDTVNDIDTGPAELEMKPSSKIPAAFPKANIASRENPAQYRNVAAHRSVHVLFLYDRIQRNAMTIRSQNRSRHRDHAIPH